jgi:hypothetical protein
MARPICVRALSRLGRRQGPCCGVMPSRYRDIVSPAGVDEDAGWWMRDSGTSNESLTIDPCSPHPPPRVLMVLHSIRTRNATGLR